MPTNDSLNGFTRTFVFVFGVAFMLAGIAGFLLILGTLWTNLSVPLERQVNFSAAGTWIFFIFFLVTGVLGIVLVSSAAQLSKDASL